MQTKPTISYHFIPIKMAINKQNQEIINVDEDVEKWEAPGTASPLYILVGM